MWLPSPPRPGLGPDVVVETWHGCCCVCVAVLNYENVVETGSETDEDDRALVSEDNGVSNGGGGEDEEAGSPASVPALDASPRVAHALLSYRDQEGSECREGLQNHHQGWRLGDGHLNSELSQHTTCRLVCSSFTESFYL